ncbi:MAG: DUF58 domain-containing protein [Pseudomonadota bacterium]
MAPDRLDADYLLRLRHLLGRDAGQRGTTALPGGLVTRRRGRGLETADLRPFEIGDDPRHIDRNATARTGHPQVRTFHAERDRTTLLIADFRPSMLWGTRRVLRSIAAAEQLCLAGWRAVAEGGRVSVIALNAVEPVYVPPRGRDRGMIGVIGGMVRAHEAAIAAEVGGGTEGPPLAHALGMAERLAPRGADVLLASGMDRPGTDFAAAARALGRRASLAILRIADPFELAPPAGTYRYIIGAEDSPAIGSVSTDPMALQGDLAIEDLSLLMTLCDSSRAVEDIGRDLPG